MLSSAPNVYINISLFQFSLYHFSWSSTVVVPQKKSNQPIHKLHSSVNFLKQVKSSLGKPKTIWLTNASAERFTNEYQLWFCSTSLIIIAKQDDKISRWTMLKTKNKTLVKFHLPTDTNNSEGENSDMQFYSILHL